jgi:hypothetical protein
METSNTADSVPQEEIVPFDSPEAARPKVMEGWLSHNGNFYLSEEIARYDGCTHRKCNDCDELVLKSYVRCEACREKSKIARYDEMPRKPWDGIAMVYSDARDEYFSDPGKAEDLIGEEGVESLESLRLIICEPNHASFVDADHWHDDLPEDGEIPPELEDAVEKLNAIIKGLSPLSWSPGKYALDLTAQETEGAK